MEGEWFISVREFLHSTECQIKTIQEWLPQLEREHNKCIMEAFPNETRENSIKINRCRIYLQATTLADITTPKGTHINTFAWGNTTTNISDTNQIESKHDWPQQPQPGPKAWYAWTTALKKYQSKDGKSNRLRQPLGKWIVNPTQSRQQREWYLDTRSNTLMHQTSTTINAHAHRKVRSYKKRSTETVTHLPNTTIPVTSRHHTVQERACDYN
jgi:hypothetical protein